MTQITYYFEKDKFMLRCVGHAGYADIGNDIVCAGISTLTQTLVSYIKSIADSFETRIEPGYLYIKAKGSISVECFKMTLHGLKLLEEAYPQHLEVIEGCPIITKKYLK